MLSEARRKELLQAAVAYGNAVHGPCSDESEAEEARNLEVLISNWLDAARSEGIVAIEDALVRAERRQLFVERWTHDCHAMCVGDAELWIERCPHCGKPAPSSAPQPALPAGLDLADVERLALAARNWHYGFPGNSRDAETMGEAKRAAERVLAALEGRSTQVNSEAVALRRLLWLRHGCEITALYGDDGEMQCSRCGIDFLRAPVEALAARISEEPR